MCYNVSYIATAGTRLGIIKNVFAVRRELRSPFRDVVPIFTRAFLFDKNIWVSLVGERHRSSEKGTTPRATETILSSEKMEAPVQIRNPYYKITGLKRFVPVSLKGWMKNEKQRNRLCDRLSNLNLDTRVKQRDQDLSSSCELASFTKRLIDGEGLISTLIRYMRMILLGSRGKAVLTLRLIKGE